MIVPRGAVVAVEEQLRRGIRFLDIAVQKIVIILVQQAAERAPIAPVDERLFAGVEYARVPHCLQLIVDAAHHMDIGEIVELQIFSDVELLLQPLRLDICHEIADLRFTRGRKRLQ